MSVFGQYLAPSADVVKYRDLDNTRWHYHHVEVIESKKIPYPGSCDGSDSLKINVQADPETAVPIVSVSAATSPFTHMLAGLGTM